MRKLDVTTPHFTDRVAEAQQLVASRDQTRRSPRGTGSFSATLEKHKTNDRQPRRRGATACTANPPGNVLSTKNGPLSSTLRPVQWGPVEFDLAHVPKRSSSTIRTLTRKLIGECRGLVLAMVAAWRWDAGDEFPERATSSPRTRQHTTQGATGGQRSSFYAAISRSAGQHPTRSWQCPLVGVG